MQYRPTTNELYLDIHRDGDEATIALARSYADAEFKADPSSWARAVDRGMIKMVADGHLRVRKEES